MLLRTSVRWEVGLPLDSSDVSLCLPQSWARLLMWSARPGTPNEPGTAWSPLNPAAVLLDPRAPATTALDPNLATASWPTSVAPVAQFLALIPATSPNPNPPEVAVVVAVVAWVRAWVARASQDRACRVDRPPRPRHRRLPASRARHRSPPPVTLPPTAGASTSCGRSVASPASARPTNPRCRPVTPRLAHSVATLARTLGTSAS